MCSEQDVWNAVRVLYLVPVTSYHVVTTFLRDITWRQGCLGIVLYVVYMGYVNEAINSKRHLNDVHLLKYASIRSWALFSYTCRTFKVEVKLLRMNVCVVRYIRSRTKRRVTCPYDSTRMASPYCTCPNSLSIGYIHVSMQDWTEHLSCSSFCNEAQLQEGKTSSTSYWLYWS